MCTRVYILFECGCSRIPKDRGSLVEERFDCHQCNVIQGTTYRFDTVACRRHAPEPEHGPRGQATPANEAILRAAAIAAVSRD